MLTNGSLFAGIGGFDLGFERAGIKTVWQVEIDPFCRRVLERHFPEARRFEDVRECGAANLERVDIIAGGFPCQDISNAGYKAGISGERSGLWAHYARIIGELRPDFVVVENVAALLGRGMERVLGDLATIGYDAEWDCLPAFAFGAPHRRDRVWIVAYPSGQGLEGLRCAIGVAAEVAKSGELLAIANAAKIKRLHGLQQRGICAELDGSPDGIEWGGQQWPEARPLLYRVDDGLPLAAHRISALGNAVVPQIAEWIGRRIVAYHEQTDGRGGTHPIGTRSGDEV